MFFSQKKIIYVEQDLAKDSILYNQNLTCNILSSAQMLFSLNNLESCAYVNLETSKNAFISLLEQLFLRTKLKKEYPYIHIDYYLKFNSQFLTRGIISQAEFQNVSYNKLKEMLIFYRYDTIILDNLSLQSSNIEIILNILNSNEISSNILIIGSKNFKDYILKNNINLSRVVLLDESLNLLDEKNNQIQLNSKMDSNNNTNFDLEKISNRFISSLITSKELQVWFLIAINFLNLKDLGTKRFFIISSTYDYSKEITFITLLKKHTKELLDIGNWDIMTLNISNLNFIDSLENNRQLNIILQSLQIEGFTNLIFSNDILLKQKSSNKNNLQTREFEFNKEIFFRLNFIQKISNENYFQITSNFNSKIYIATNFDILSYLINEVRLDNLVFKFNCLKKTTIVDI
ncbi:MAG: hypothetical protein ACMXYB_03690 [Candidatus Woesearchaeota archaeon]